MYSYVWSYMSVCVSLHVGAPAVSRWGRALRGLESAAGIAVQSAAFSLASDSDQLTSFHRPGPSLSQSMLKTMLFSPFDLPVTSHECTQPQNTSKRRVCFLFHVMQHLKNNLSWINSFDSLFDGITDCLIRALLVSDRTDTSWTYWYRCSLFDIWEFIIMGNWSCGVSLMTSS